MFQDWYLPLPPLTPPPRPLFKKHTTVIVGYVLQDVLEVNLLILKAAREALNSAPIIDVIHLAILFPAK